MRKAAGGEPPARQMRAGNMGGLCPVVDRGMLAYEGVRWSATSEVQLRCAREEWVRRAAHP